MELKRFPSLQNDISTAAAEALDKFREDSRKTVIRLVEMESSYLTVEFFRKLPLEPEKGANNTSAPATDRYSENHYRRIGSNVSAYIGMVCDTLRNTIPKAVVYCQVREARRNLLNHFYSQVGRRESGHEEWDCLWMIYMKMLARREAKLGVAAVNLVTGDKHAGVYSGITARR